jgi:hypothetical protein
MAATVAFVDWMTRHRFEFHRHPFTPSGVGTLQHLDDLTSGPDDHRRNEPGGHARSHRQIFDGPRCSVWDLINRCIRSDHGEYAVHDCRRSKHSVHLRGHVRSAFCSRWGFRSHHERSRGSVLRVFGHESYIDSAPAARAAKRERREGPLPCHVYRGPFPIAGSTAIRTTRCRAR